MIAWTQDSTLYRERKRLMREAKKYVRENYPDRIHDLTFVAETYSIEVLGESKDYLKLNTKRDINYSKVKKATKKQRCPKCGGNLTLVPMPQCKKVNTQGYTLLLDCEKCMYHAYVLDTPIEAYYKIANNKTLNLREGRL